MINRNCFKKLILYKASDIKILIPEVKEAGPAGIVPNSSTVVQLAIGDAIAIATMKQKNLVKKISRIPSSGSLGYKLKSVEDLMLTGKKYHLLVKILI